MGKDKRGVSLIIQKGEEAKESNLVRANLLNGPSGTQQASQSFCPP